MAEHEIGRGEDRNEQLADAIREAEAGDIIAVPVPSMIAPAREDVGRAAKDLTIRMRAWPPRRRTQAVPRVAT